jgi:hypothetical protein
MTLEGEANSLQQINLVDLTSGEEQIAPELRLLDENMQKWWYNINKNELTEAQ